MLLAGMFASTPGSAQYAERGVYQATPERVAFMGALTEPRVVEIIAALEKWQAKELIIDSMGGPIGDGLTLGEWILRNGVTVTVNTVCFSSCANYVFLAARRKRVLDGGIVVWHGSAEQKNYRERDARVAELSDRRARGEPLNPTLTLLLERDAARVAKSTENRARQHAFFASIGVKEYITRAGQEPSWSYPGDGWTLTAQDMRLFCVDGLELPADYGSEAYISRFNAKLKEPRSGPARLYLEEAIRAEIARSEPLTCAPR